MLIYLLCHLSVENADGLKLCSLTTEGRTPGPLSEISETPCLDVLVRRQYQRNADKTPKVITPAKPNEIAAINLQNLALSSSSFLSLITKSESTTLMS
uniref:Uncharacterized protein n=1 Tax=Meloidogyne incognita TaxID=6306 RepID=A0A914L298_MELIC